MQTSNSRVIFSDVENRKFVVKTKRPTYNVAHHHNHHQHQPIAPATATMAVPGAQPNQQPDFIRYYLQFPAVTRTFLTLIFLTSVSIQLGFINRYTLYTSFLGSFLRFFDAGWGIWFLMTLVMSTSLVPYVLFSGMC
jgi:hypothetical protein